ncbi:hypothetical protein WJX73_007482 [Symbiochloris irregularis]|uniref:Protein kinase domain-containing protein n=1 Tax=Symbiochloris irregularis TaxID=706552 RepID=A0AAW1P6K1_9CHLO
MRCDIQASCSEANLRPYAANNPAGQPLVTLGCARAPTLGLIQPQSLLKGLAYRHKGFAQSSRSSLSIEGLLPLSVQTAAGVSGSARQSVSTSHSIDSASAAPSAAEQGEPQVIARTASSVQAVKHAVAELRISVKCAVSHREKCSILLSAAMAASLALEQVLYAGPIERSTEHQIQRLCSELLAVTDLADTRVKVYGGGARWKKYVKVMQRKSVQAKFDELVHQLKSLTTRAWNLQTQQSMPRISVSRLGNHGDSADLENAVLNDLRQGIQHTVLTRTRIRRGGQAQKIRALMYIPPGQSSGTHKALGQVWWYSANLLKGKLSVHDIATSRTVDVPVSMPVSCLQLDAQNNIWIGYRGGHVHVYSEASTNPICPPLKCCTSDVTAMMMARSGTAWVGAEDGSVHLVSMVTSMARGHAAMLQLSTRQATTRSWRSLLSSPRPSGPTSHADSVPHNYRGTLSSEATADMGGGPGHSGPVTAIQGCSTRVWTAGGEGKGSGASLIEWSTDGRVRHALEAAPHLGSINAMAVMPMWDRGRKVAGRLASVSSDPEQVLAAAPAVVAEVVNWILASAHESGTIQVWDGRGGPVVPCFVIPAWDSSPCRNLVVCEPLGLWCAGHANGTIVLRLLQSLDLDGAPPAQAGQAVGPLQPPAEHATLQAHRSGLDAMVGCSLGVFTASMMGSLTLFPEAELRQAAEASGFVLPSDYEAQQHLARLHSGSFPHIIQALGADRDSAHSQSVSTMLQRYFTPASGALAVAAVERAITKETQRQSGMLSADGTPMSEVVALMRSQDANSGEARRTSSQSMGPTSPWAGDSRHSVRPSDSTADFASKADNRGSGSGSGGAADDGLAVEDLSRDLGSLATGNFRAEAHSDWLVEFKDLQFVRLIGEGSIGRVHHGRWQETDVAIKTLNSLQHIQASMSAAEHAPDDETMVEECTGDDDPPPIAVDSGFRSDEAAVLRSLEREVSVMASIRHPNVVLFMGVCLQPACLVTEWCSRGSVYDILAKARKNPALAAQLEWPRRLAIALDAAKGMLQLHSHRPVILHRDLKSPNLVVDKHWRCKVTDFNLSRVMNNTTVTSSVSANNPRWLAPEAIASQHFSKAADVYSFGVVLWELVTWQLPWDEFGPFQIMVAVSEKGQRPDIPEDLTQTPGGDSLAAPGLIDLILRCWHQDPEERPGFDTIVTSLRNLLGLVAQQRRMSQQPGRTSHAGSPQRLSSDLPPRASSDGGQRTIVSSNSLPTGAHDAHPAGHETQYNSAQSSLVRVGSDATSLSHVTERTSENPSRPSDARTSTERRSHERSLSSHTLKGPGRNGTRGATTGEDGNPGSLARSLQLRVPLAASGGRGALVHRRSSFAEEGTFGHPSHRRHTSLTEQPLTENEARLKWRKSSPVTTAGPNSSRWNADDGIATLLATIGGGKHPQYPSSLAQQGSNSR